MEIQESNVMRDAENIKTQKAKAVAKEFEMVFVEFMMKDAMKDIGNSGVNDKDNDLYRMMLTEEYAKAFAANVDMGIGKNIEENILMLQEVNYGGNSSK